MITVTGLTKRFGDVTAVDALSFEVPPGRVTGFLGPNGAGKSTTMRMIMGLEHPSAGAALIKGVPYAQLQAPLRTVGALLEARSFHPGRSARAHLRWLAASNGLPPHRVDEVLEITGLTDVASRRAGTFSLGMGQRLGVAAALLGDPEVLLLDEPVNGLDPEGILWIRTLLRKLAAEGRTVFVSSHLMSEMAQTADHVIVIGRGKLLADTPMAEFIASSSSARTLVRTPNPDMLASTLRERGATVVVGDDGSLTVTGLMASEIGEIAFERGIVLHELSPQSASLEEAFFALTGEDTSFRGQSANAHEGVSR